MAISGNRERPMNHAICHERNAKTVLNPIRS